MAKSLISVMLTSQILFLFEIAIFEAELTNSQKVTFLSDSPRLCWLTVMMAINHV